ncbi:MAG: bacteriochlorophyll 4-vinyl reductase [Congregibacter sp.]
MNAPLWPGPSTKPQPWIGPNSVLQLVPLLEEALGSAECQHLMDLSGLDGLPHDQGLMREAPAAKLHQAVRAHHPLIAPALTRKAGERTADYIIEHRIPIAALKVLRRLPPWLAGPLLGRIIEKHSWTFAGSGRFRLRSRLPLVFELADNPVVRGESADKPICDWHAAVFQRLFSDIIDPDMRCVETLCCAKGDPCCRFEVG